LTAGVGVLRLLKLDVDALHELHYQMITLGKVCDLLLCVQTLLHCRSCANLLIQTDTLLETC
jgi:hypothetical protein